MQKPNPKQGDQELNNPSVEKSADVGETDDRLNYLLMFMYLLTDLGVT